MWIVLPTKGCECVTCKKIREVIDEDGNPVTGASVTDIGSGYLDVPGLPTHTCVNTVAMVDGRPPPMCPACLRPGALAKKLDEIIRAEAPKPSESDE